MPTERFYHLSEKKKEMIREAAVQEFIRVSPEQASINQIVRNAEISRGSFYTYFEDKEDLMRYVFEDLIHQVREFCKNLLRDSGGDFWTLQQGLMDFVLQICREDKMPALTRTESGHNTLMRLMWEKSSDEVCPEEIWMGELYQLTDCSRLRVGSLQEYRILFSICIHCILAEIAELYEKGKTEAEVRESFAKRLDYIRYGAAEGEAGMPGSAAAVSEKTEKQRGQGK